MYCAADLSSLLQTEDQHSRYLLFRSVWKDHKLDWAPYSTARGCSGTINNLTNSSPSAATLERLPCCVSTASTEQLQRQDKSSSPEREVDAIPKAYVDGAAVGLDSSSGGLSDLIDDAKATQPPHMLPSCREEDHGELLAASCVCTGSSGKADTTCHSEQILSEIFIRRALSAGNEMDSKVDSISDAIRQSNSSSAWFTR